MVFWGSFCSDFELHWGMLACYVRLHGLPRRQSSEGCTQELGRRTQIDPAKLVRQGPGQIVRDPSFEEAPRQEAPMDDRTQDSWGSTARKQQTKAKVYAEEAVFVKSA